jgi:hypothetical protein
MLAEIQEVTRLLSFLLERIAMAADLNLHFQYDHDFEFGNHRYNLQETEDYLVLTESE